MNSAAVPMAHAGSGARDEKAFHPDALVTHFEACRDHAGDIPLADFIAGCDEVKKIVCE